MKVLSFQTTQQFLLHKNYHCETKIFIFSFTSSLAFFLGENVLLFLSTHFKWCSPVEDL